jgi:hypothetical protein
MCKRVKWNFKVVEAKKHRLICGHERKGLSISEQLDEYVSLAAYPA